MSRRPTMQSARNDPIMEAFETSAVSAANHPFFKILEYALFSSTAGRVAGLAFDTIIKALIGAFAYLLALRLDRYIEYEMDLLTSYKSQSLLIQTILVFVILLALSITYAVLKPYMRRKFRGSPEDLYDDETKSFIDARGMRNDVSPAIT